MAARPPRYLKFHVDQPKLLQRELDAFGRDVYEAINALNTTVGAQGPAGPAGSDGADGSSAQSIVDWKWTETDTNQISVAHNTAAPATEDVEVGTTAPALLELGFAAGTNIAAQAPCVWTIDDYALQYRQVLRMHIWRLYGLNVTDGAVTVAFGPMVHNNNPSDFWAFGVALESSGTTSRIIQIESGAVSVSSDSQLVNPSTSTPTNDPFDLGSVYEWEIFHTHGAGSDPPAPVWFARSMGSNQNSDPVARYSVPRLLTAGTDPEDDGSGISSGWQGRTDLTHLGFVGFANTATNLRTFKAYLGELMILKHPMDYPEAV